MILATILASQLSCSVLSGDSFVLTGLNRRVTGAFPALKRWAIFFHPFGIENQDLAKQGRR